MEKERKRDKKRVRRGSGEERNGERQGEGEEDIHEEGEGEEERQGERYTERDIEREKKTSAWRGTERESRGSLDGVGQVWGKNRMEAKVVMSGTLSLSFLFPCFIVFFLSPLSDSFLTLFSQSFSLS